MHFNAMSEHRFTLSNDHGRKKLACPKCHQPKCFTPYIDTWGEIHFPNYVGRCDHEKQCNWHYKPKHYFQDNPNFEFTRPPNPVRREVQKPPELPTLYMSQDLMLATLKGYERNALYVFMSGIIGEEKCLEIFKRYNVGTAKMMGGSTVFWQVDCQGRIRTGKVMRYGNDGHRVKEDGNAKLTWVHTIKKQTGFQMRQCFFGEHLLPFFPNRTIILVESEKSALIASHFFPDYLWLATGGCNGCLNATASQVFKGRDVKLLPDLDKTDKWREKAKMLRPICRSVEVLTWLTDRATEEQRERGLDVADFLLEAVRQPVGEQQEVMTDQQVFERMMAENQDFRTFAEALELECVTPHRINEPGACATLE